MAPGNEKHYFRKAWKLSKGICADSKNTIRKFIFVEPLEKRAKILQVAKTFLGYRQEDLERILSDEGILLRIEVSSINGTLWMIFTEL